MNRFKGFLLFTFLVMSFDVFAEDEIESAIQGIVASGASDAPPIFIPGTPLPAAACQAYRGTSGHAQDFHGDCVTGVSSVGPNNWVCHADKFHRPEGNPPYCAPPTTGSSIFGGLRSGVICPFDYKPVVAEGSASFTDTETFSQGIFYTGLNAENTHCQRCLSPFTWDEERKVCVTECPDNQDFEPALGMCVEKTNQLEENFCSEMDGNPVFAKTGEKRQQESPDYQGGGSFPITFTRNYNSFRAPAAPKHNSMAVGSTASKEYFQSPNYEDQRQDLGWNIPTNVLSTRTGSLQWRHFYMSQIVRASISGNSVMVVRPNGSKRVFYLSNNLYKAKNGNKDKLFKLSPSDENKYWAYHTPQNIREIYDQAGKLRELHNRQGQYQTLAYDSQERLTSITGSDGRSISLGYDEQDRLSHLTDPAGKQVLYEYSQTGNLETVTYPDDDTDSTNNPKLQYHYENVNFPLALTGKTDAKGTRIATWQYDSEGRVVSSSHVNGSQATQFNYHPDKVVVTKNNGYEKTLNYQNGRLISVEGDMCASDGTKGTTQFKYHSYGYMTEKIDADGTRTQYRGRSNGQPREKLEGYISGFVNLAKTTYLWHDDFNLPTQVKNDWYRTTNYVYGVNGRMEKATVTAGSESRITTYSYHASGQLASIDGPREDVSDVMQFAYKANGDLDTITNALGHVTRFNSYDAHGRVTEVEDENGVLTHYSYDARGRLTQVISGSRTFQFTYDENGNLVSTNDGNRALTYQYDSDNRLTGIVDAQGNSISHTLDAYDNITKTTISDSEGVLVYSVSQTFDKLNRLETIVSADNQIETMEYDVVGNLVKTVSPLQQTNQQVMDGIKRLTKTTDAMNGEINYTYDKLGNVTSVTDQNNKVTQYTYNGFNEVTKIVSPDTGTTHLTYDKAGNLLTKKDARNITVTYQYDVLNRMTVIQYPTTELNITQGYDDPTVNRHGIGRLTSVSGNGISYQYHYNADGQISQVDTSHTYLSQTLNFTTHYGYSQGLLTSLTYPSGTELTYSYDSGHVSSIKANFTDDQGVTHQRDLATGISYQPFGPLSSLTYGNGKQLTLAYAQDGALTRKYTSGVLDTNYSLDANNKITAISEAIQATNEAFAYDANDRLTNATGNYGDLNFNYDAVGNRLSKTTDNVVIPYSYSTNKLIGQNGISYSYDSNGNLVGRDTETYQYNDANRLSSASVSTGDYHYRYNYAGQRVIKQGNGQVRHYHYDMQGMLLEETDNNGNSLVEYVYVNGQRIAIKTGNDIYFVHTNHLDAPRAMTNSSGQLVWEASYNPFGKVTITTNTLPESLTARFPGQFFDEETEFHYNYFRDYDPELGRYIQSDPIGLRGGINTYGYVSGNPINRFDSTGLLEEFTYKLNFSNTSTLQCECGDSFSAFSGAEGAYNNPTLTDRKNYGPIPKGTYYIVQRESGGRLGGLYDFFSGADSWFSLYRDDGKIDDFTEVNDITRGQFRMHPGGRSAGCITLSDKNEFEKLSKLLRNTETALIPGTDIVYYGTVKVY